MNAGTRYEQWQIVLVPFPYSDLSSVKRRPALVLSTSDFNGRHDDLVCCMITSHLDGEPGCPTFSQDDLASGLLAFDSKIKPYRLFTVEKALVVKKLGVLGASKAMETRIQLLRLFGFS
ncbi:type II toxin-antitoxin system PemK/MazF family toxin [Candidatus Micrarchaeota archaeon]|nr:type II toxin-antitoxin system PemK/MazF family toxin [Candidatus Micrarchaeota archaeon]